MFRLVVACAGVALLCAAAYFVSSPLLAGYTPGYDVRTFLAALALIASLVALVVSLQTMRSNVSLRADLHILARSLDLALKQVVTRSDRHAANFGEIATSVSNEVERLAHRVAVQADADERTGPSNVVPHPAARRTKAVQAAAPTAGDAEAAYARAVTAGAFDLSLQPIVSLAGSVAVGFEVFASLALEGGQRIDMRRPAEPAAPGQAAAFERILFMTAMQTGRKRLGSASANMPLHVALSEALLGDGREFGAVLETLQFYPDLTKSLVLSLPAPVFDSAQHRQALDLLSARGVPLAAEGWLEDGQEVAQAALSFVKITANRLLDRDKSRRKYLSGPAIVEWAAREKVTIIATEVSSDEDAVTLLDLGVELMAGPRFGGPRRLKAEDGKARLAQL